MSEMPIVLCLHVQKDVIYIYKKHKILKLIYNLKYIYLLYNNIDLPVLL